MMNKTVKIFSLAIITIMLCGQNNQALGQAVAKDKEEKKEQTKEKDTKGNGIFKGLNGKDEDANLPVLIRSDTVSLDAKKRVFTYKGNVEVTRGEVIITADKLNGTYDENNKLEQIIFEQNVVLTKAEALRATANHALYKVKQDTVEMTEAPEVIENGNALTADKITVFLKEDRSEAQGNVRVKLIKTDSNPMEVGKAKNGNKTALVDKGKEEEKE